MMELNRLYNEDCLETMARMPDEFVDCVVTDIPYEMPEIHSNGIGNQFYKGRANKGFINKQLVEMLRCASKWVVLFHGKEQTTPIWNTASKFNLRLGVWVKGDPAPTNGQHGYLSGLEIFTAIKKPRSPFYGHCKNPVFHYNTERNVNHSTPKPINLMREIIRDISKPGDIVYDPFIGSGTTAVACIQEGRQWVGSELDADYCAAANKRIAQALKQPTLFDPEEMNQPIQGDLFDE